MAQTPPVNCFHRVRTGVTLGAIQLGGNVTCVQATQGMKYVAADRAHGIEVLRLEHAVARRVDLEIQLFERRRQRLDELQLYIVRSEQ